MSLKFEITRVPVRDMIEFLQAHIRWENRRQVAFDESSMVKKVQPGPIKPDKIVCKFGFYVFD